MSEDYKRAVCGFCPFMDRCNAYRDKVWCGDCDTALVCAMKSDMDSRGCDTAKARWKTSLPRKCMLAQRVLSQFAEASNRVAGAQEGADGFIRKDGNPACPRCLCPGFITNFHHGWAPYEGRVSMLQGTCDICSLDDEVKLP